MTPPRTSPTRLLSALAACTVAALALAAMPATAGPVIIGDPGCVIAYAETHVMYANTASAAPASAGPSQSSTSICGDPGLGFAPTCGAYTLDVGVQAYGRDVQVCLDQDAAGNPCLSAYANGAPLSRTCADHDAYGNLCASTYAFGSADRTCVGSYPGEGPTCVAHSDASLGDRADDYACLTTDEEGNLCAADSLFENGFELARDRTCEGTYAADGSPCAAHRATLLGIPVEDRLCGYSDPATGDPCVQDVVYVSGFEQARDAQCVHESLTDPCTYNVVTDATSPLATASLCLTGVGGPMTCLVAQAQLLSVGVPPSPVCPVVPNVSACPTGQVGVVVDTTSVCTPVPQPGVSQCPPPSIGVTVNGDPSTCVQGGVPAGVATCGAYGGAYANEVGIVIDNNPPGPDPNDQAVCLAQCPPPAVGVELDNSPTACAVPPTVGSCPPGQVGAVVDNSPPGPSGNDISACVTPPTVTPCGPGTVGYMVNYNPATCVTPPTLCPSSMPGIGWAPGVNGICVGLPWYVAQAGPDGSYCRGSGTTATVAIVWGSTAVQPGPATTVCI